MPQKLSTQPYKGSRDFFPEDMQFRNWMFNCLRNTVKSYAYHEIDAPIIEPIEIYLAKTSEEIINKQVYSFTDRGDRKVALRPEMTPTVSRMIASRIRETPRPIRWFSIPNLWRYEKMGKGRLREHWQLNCDLFGAGSEDLADLELIMLAIDILRNFGADQRHFKVHLSDRRFMNSYLKNVVGLEEKYCLIIAQIMDKKTKISENDFKKLLNNSGLNTPQIDSIISYMESDTIIKEHQDLLGAKNLLKLLNSLEDLKMSEYVQFDPSIIRGFDYYTGMIFEIYDKSPENSRSLFGGGRYNNLVGLFNKENIDAVGFGMGDVTLQDFLYNHALVPKFENTVDFYIAWFDGFDKYAIKIARRLRSLGAYCELNLGYKNLSKQLQEANRKGFRFSIIVGEEEEKTSTFQVKNLSTGNQKTISINSSDKLFIESLKLN